MRRALAFSLALHGGLAAIVLIGMSFGPRRLPEPTPLTIDIVELAPQRVTPKAAPPAVTAPLPKREAAAVNPGPRTERAQLTVPSQPVAPTEAPVTAAEPDSPRPAATPPEPSPVRPEPAPRRAVVLDTPEPRPQSPAPRQVANTEPDRPTPRPARPSEPAAKPAAPKATAKPAETQPTRTPKADPTPSRSAPKAETRPASPAKGVTPEKVQARTEQPEQPAPKKQPQMAAKPTTTEKTEAKSAPKVAEDSLDALLKSVENQPRRLQAPEQREGRGQNLEVAVSDSQKNQLIAAAKRQMEECWRIPTGLRGADAVPPFPVNVKFNPDGTARSVRVLAQPSGGDASVAQIVAESAQRAAWSCKLSLPAELYAEWQDINFNFDPKQAVAG